MIKWLRRRLKRLDKLRQSNQRLNQEMHTWRARALRAEKANASLSKCLGLMADRINELKRVRGVNS